MRIADTKRNIELMNSQCHRYTFQPKKIRTWVVNEICGHTLNLFAGKTILREGNVRIDKDPDMPDLTFVMDSEDFLKMALKEEFAKFDTIIFDPPWNARKAREKYEGRYIGKFTKLKEDIVKLLNPRGKIISAGYKISYFGKKRGFNLEKVLVVNPGGDINPFFIVVERKETGQE